MKPKDDNDYFVLRFGINRPLHLPRQTARWSITPAQAALSLLVAVAVLTGGIYALIVFR